MLQRLWFQVNQGVLKKVGTPLSCYYVLVMNKKMAQLVLMLALPTKQCMEESRHV